MKKVILIFLLFLIFRSWFSFALLSSGDWHYLFPQSLLSWTPGLWAWDTFFGNGLGNSDVFLLPLNSYFLFLSHFFLPFLNWIFIERIIFFFPYLVLSLISSYIFLKTFSVNTHVGYGLGIFLFIANTYALMLVGGGQMGVALAYAIAPLVLGLFAKFLFQKVNSYILCVATSIVLALQVALDIRITYVTLAAVAMLIFFSIPFRLEKEKLIQLGLIIMTTILLNAFWLLPLAIVHQNPLQQMGAIYTTQGAVEFFSFAKFENTLGLMHPNWPENIFGKVGFMKPEFLLMPILAYSSLLFIKRKGDSEEKKKNKLILYFVTLGLISGFLAKGANEPFGFVYLWMFDHVPGFIMFRDPTKWYLLIVLSYTLLIPYSLKNIYEILKRRFA